MLTYSKKTVIDDKVFKEEDIHLFARWFEELYSDDDYLRLIRLRFDDDSVIEGDAIDVFSTDAFKRRMCKAIRFEYTSKHYERYLRLELINYALWTIKSEIEIRSTDQVWYEAMLNRWETAVNEVEDQKRFVRHLDIATILLSMFEAALFSVIVQLKFISTKIGFISVLLLVVSYSVFFLINCHLAEKVEKAYPRVEFAFGPMHRNDSIKKKHVIGLAVPFIIDVLLSVLSTLIQ